MEFTIDKFAKEVAEKALDEITYEGKTIREWAEILVNQQPSEDVVSREAVLELAKKGILVSNDNYKCVVNAIKSLPSVTPKQKTGRWLMPQQDDGMSDPIYYQVRCSECGFDLDPQTWHMELHQYGADKYCPKCGARMAESEDKE